jgi:hypothetical protein
MSVWRKTALGILILLVLTGGLCWLKSAWILDQLLRPQLEQLASRRLAAEVGIGQLRLTPGGLELQGLRLRRDGLKIFLPQVEADFTLSALLQGRLDALRLLQPHIEISASASQTAEPQPALHVPTEFPLTIAHLTLSQGEVQLELEGRHLLLRQIAFAGAWRSAFPFKLDLMIGAEDTHPLSLGGNLGLGSELTLTLEHLDFQQRSLLAGPLSFSLAASDLAQGTLSLRLAQFDQQQLREMLDVLAVDYPLPEALRFSLREAQIELRLNGRQTEIAVNMAAAQIVQGKLSLFLTLNRLRLLRTATGWSASGQLSGPAESTLDFSGDYLGQSATIEKFSIALQQAGRPLLQADGQPRQLKFNLAPVDRVRLQTLFGSGNIPPQVQALTSFTASGRVTAAGEKGWVVHARLAAKQLRLADLELSKIAGELQLQYFGDQLKLRQLDFSAALSRGTELSAQLAGRLSGEILGPRYRATLDRVKLSGITYLSADGQTGLGAGVLELSGSLAGAGAGPLRFDLFGSGGAAEFLAGSFYADLSGQKSLFRLAGELLPRQRRLSFETLQVELPALGSLNMSGHLDAAEAVLKGRLELPDLAGAYGQHLAPLLAESSPVVTALSLNGGLAVDGAFLWRPEGWRLAGALQPQKLGAIWADKGLALVDADGRIPFELGGGQMPEEAGFDRDQAGELSFAALSLGLVRLERERLSLVAGLNQLTVRSPFKLSLAGGQVEIADLTFGVDQGEPSGAVRVKVEAIDLSTLARELDLPPLQGNFSADLGLIRYAERQLATAGTATLDIFGGQMLLRNMRYQAPFSSYPVFLADLDFSGIDLLQATRIFEFGEMNGIVDGWVHGLRLFGITPSAFSARLETRDSGKRNISVKALNNLSILSQGGLSAALSRGIYRFIDFYRYAKIGFACTLENDTFTLIGTARSDTANYLVAGSLLPPRIDITTTTPTISFKEMLKRLGRIDRTGS